MKREEVRGQTTVFVIIGLVLVLLVALALVMTSKRAEPVGQGGRLDAQPVVDYVQSCLEQTGKRTFQLLGRQGGYIDLGSLSQSPIATESDVLVDGPERIPFWYSVDPCQTREYGCFTYREPPLCKRSGSCILNSSGDGSIEEQAEAHIAATLVECIDGFKPLAGRLTVREEKPPVVDVIFTADDVGLHLTYPLVVVDEGAGGRVKLSSFDSFLPIDFEEVYRLSHDVLTLQRQTQFLENVLLHVMGPYQGVDQQLPPFRDFEFSYERKHWIRTSVQDFIQRNIMPYIMTLQVRNAYAGYRPIIPPLDPTDSYYLYESGFWNYAELQLGEGGDSPVYPDLGVRFRAPTTDIFLNINDKEFLQGQRIEMPGGIIGSLVGSLLPFTQYRFKYDIAFPVVVTISAPDALFGEGYWFQYAMEGNILNNIPMNESFNPERYEFEGDIIDLNSPEQQVQSTITVRVKDRRTQTPVNEAFVYYDCGNRFLVGITGSTAPGEWQGQMPYCAWGGVISVEHVGYVSDGVAYNNRQAGSAFTKEFQLWPLAEKTVTVFRKLPPNTTAAPLVSGEHPQLHLNGTQQALVRISRLNETPYESQVPVVNFFIFGPDGAPSIVDFGDQRDQVQELYNTGQIEQEQYDELMQSIGAHQARTVMHSSVKNITLVPGKYELDAQLLWRGNLTIPAARIHGEPVPEKNFTAWPQGGAKLFDHYAFTVSPSDAYGVRNLVIYVLEQPLPRSWSDLENMEELETWQQPYIAWIQPEWQ